MTSVLEIQNYNNVYDRQPSFIYAEYTPYLAPTGSVYFGRFGPCECGGEGVANCDVSIQGLNYDRKTQKQLDQPECRLLYYIVGVKGDFL